MQDNSVETVPAGDLIPSNSYQVTVHVKAVIYVQAQEGEDIEEISRTMVEDGMIEPDNISEVIVLEIEDDTIG